MSNHVNMTPEQKEKKDQEMYQRVVLLILLPVILYFVWPLFFGQKEAEIVEDIRTELTEDDVVQTSSSADDKKGIITYNTTGGIGATAGAVALILNRGDEIEYIKQPQNTGWKGIVRGKGKGIYEVEITDVLIDNKKRQYLTPNPCTGEKLIGLDFVGRKITVPGSCIHGE